MLQDRPLLDVRLEECMHRPVAHRGRWNLCAAPRAHEISGGYGAGHDDGANARPEPPRDVDRLLLHRRGWLGGERYIGSGGRWRSRRGYGGSLNRKRRW